MVGNIAVKNVGKCLDEQFGIPFDAFWKPCSPNQDWSLGAHKFVLAMNSDVFHDMFYGSDGSEDVTEDPDCKGDVVVKLDGVTNFNVAKMIVQFCYCGKIDQNFAKYPQPVELLIDLYIGASLLKIEALKELVLKQRIIRKVVETDEVDVDKALVIVEKAIKHKEHDLLSDALLTKAADFLKTSYREGPLQLPIFLRKKIDDERVLRIMLEKLDLEDRCKNCKSYDCLNGENVNKMNFVPGARVRVKNARSGRGNPALVKLGNLDEVTSKFSGFSASGLPTQMSVLGKGVYVFDCLQYLD